MTTLLPHKLDADPPSLRRLGLIVLQVDETIEADMQQLIPASAARLHITRIPSGADLTPDTIATMKTGMTDAARLLPDVGFDCIGYGCTSGTTLIGATAVADKVRAGRPTNAVTDPLTAALTALQLLNLWRIAIVSPYIPSVAEPVADAFRANGAEIVDAVSFGVQKEAQVARIAAASIRDAVLHVGRNADIECIFLSCTNLRTLSLIPDLEVETGRTVLSSNQVLAWDMARRAGVRLPKGLPGRLFDQL